MPAGHDDGTGQRSEQGQPGHGIASSGANEQLHDGGGGDLTQAFHVDHIFPRSRFTRRDLANAGVPLAKIDDYLARVDTRPNLQLLAGIPNIEKQAALPTDWLIGPHFPSSEKRDGYLQQNDLVGLPLELGDFLEFHAARRELMAQR